ncbi:MAG: tubulin-like doman-containing protein [Anaerolineae bacterium]
MAMVQPAGVQARVPNTRPTVVVGVGGTGVDVVTDVKRALINAYGGVPANVQLLAFDLVAFMQQDQNGGQQPQDYFGRIQLAQDREYVHVARDGRVSWLGPEGTGWFPKERFIQTYGDVTFAAGAAAHRSVGRAALFYDLQQYGGSAIMASLRRAR